MAGLKTEITYTIDKDNNYYVQKEGIVLGDDFLDIEEFTTYLNTLKQDSVRMENFRYAFMSMTRWFSITEQNGKPTINETFISNLENATSILRNNVFGNLGGTIRLITSFNDNGERKMYDFARESDLTAYENIQGGLLYRNTLVEAEYLLNHGKKSLKVSNAITQHFSNFQQELNQPLTGDAYKIHRQRIHQWASIYLPDRYSAGKNKDKTRPVYSLASYIFGKKVSSRVGYAQEAFITHVAQYHHQLDFSEGSSADSLNRGSVVDEYQNKYSDFSLLNLLASAKGNISSQLGGDNIIIDNKGTVIFNVQSKASNKTSAEFEITYQKFLKDMRLIYNLLEQANQPLTSGDPDTKKIFDKLKAVAWVPVSKDVKEKIIDDAENKVLQSLIPK